MTHGLMALVLLLQQQPTVALPDQGPQGPTTAAAMEQLAAAEARYRSAIALTPGIAAYHESLAQVLERQGRLDEALASHAEAVRLDPASARAREGLGGLLLRMGRASEALPHLEAASRFDPSSAAVRAMLATARQGTGEVADAGAARDTGREPAPTNAATARAPGAGAASTDATGYHDYSGFADDDSPRWTLTRVLEWVFAILLALSAIPLLGPVLGTLLLIISSAPRLLRRRAASST